jgi:hypothetical protein
MFAVASTNAFWKARGSPTQIARPEKRTGIIYDQDNLNGLIIMTTKIIVIKIATGVMTIVHITIMTLDVMNAGMVTIIGNETGARTGTGTTKTIKEMSPSKPTAGTTNGKSLTTLITLMKMTVSQDFHTHPVMTPLKVSEDSHAVTLS